MTKSELEELFAKIGKGEVDSAIKEADKISNRVVRTINGLNQDILDKLHDEAENGKVPSSKVNTADSVIRAVGREYVTEIEDAILDAVERMGGEMVDRYVKSSTKYPEVSALLSASLIATIKKDVTKEIFAREINGARLKDRVRALSTMLTYEVMKSVKYGVLLKESVAKTFRKVTDAIKANVWQIKRILTSELLTTLRMATLLFGEMTGIVKAVRIIDNRGRHGGHTLHKCYIYAEEDKYGWGKGVYKVTDRFILDPHPNCTAYFEFILNDKLFGKDA